MSNLAQRLGALRSGVSRPLTPQWRINRANPLTAGLRACVRVVAGRPYDFVNRRFLTPYNSGVGAHRDGVDGNGFTAADVTSGAVVFDPGQWSFATTPRGATFFNRLRMTDPGNPTATWGSADASTGKRFSTRYRANEITGYFNGETTGFFVRSNGQDAIILSGLPHSSLFSYGPSGIHYVQNGALLATEANNPFASIVNTDTVNYPLLLCNGRYNANTAEHFAFDVWDRQLTRAEAESVTNGGWRGLLIDPLADLIARSGPVAAGGGDATVAPASNVLGLMATSPAIQTGLTLQTADAGLSLVAATPALASEFAVNPAGTAMIFNIDEPAVRPPLSHRVSTRVHIVQPQPLHLSIPHQRTVSPDSQS